MAYRSVLTSERGSGRCDKLKGCLWLQATERKV
jgi:hypothetical protein